MALQQLLSVCLRFALCKTVLLISDLESLEQWMDITQFKGKGLEILRSCASFAAVSF